MKVFHVSWNDPETVFHEIIWKKNFTVYPSLKVGKNKSKFKNDDSIMVLLYLKCRKAYSEVRLFVYPKEHLLRKF